MCTLTGKATAPAETARLYAKDAVLWGTVSEQLRVNPTEIEVRETSRRETSRSSWSIGYATWMHLGWAAGLLRLGVGVLSVCDLSAACASSLLNSSLTLFSPPLRAYPRAGLLRSVRQAAAAAGEALPALRARLRRRGHQRRVGTLTPRPTPWIATTK